MSAGNTDRNLLFGILALQMDFIGRDALVAGMNAWLLDKAKPLGRALCEQGALNSERHADDAHSRARFMLEAEVAGGLEHPGVVPVYGLGHYADGRPFYAMRFVKGDSLKDAIERFHQAAARLDVSGERALEFRRLLG